MGGSGRVVCVTLNAAIDRTYYHEDLRIGHINRVQKVVSQAGGKGNNVARAIHRLGGCVTATGFVAGQNGQFIEVGLQKEGIATAFCTVPAGESRVCLTLVDAANHTATEFMEPGVAITMRDVEQLCQQLKGMVEPGSFVIFSGSLPPGCTISAFAHLIEVTQRLGARVVVDTSGDALIHAARCRPYAMKPNEHEVEALLANASGAESELPADRETKLRDMLVQLQQSGVALPIVTLGSNGCIACDHDTIYRVHAPEVSVKNAVGSGDCFLGGVVYGLATGQSISSALAIGTAAGAVNATKESAGMIQHEEVMHLAGQIQVTAEPWVQAHTSPRS
ncbi:1-phosphofructokinase family hexose kinase [Alicyclobacillus fastidiosus]|uniref:Tagatose-6-phosphate kinase n=1 Tax=Alicyclobacillus fastidiosus TaxID=392011 RepID=A0ABV5A9D3_9BACL|nr:1-phosphofructokinase family hexose kinase [Alicyclobacillus fastidiosus]WEH10629.1 1-phosphofructokinase family hexose kinase [Alicyclobacillus fastidiosus]